MFNFKKLVLPVLCAVSCAFGSEKQQMALRKEFKELEGSADTALFLARAHNTDKVRKGYDKKYGSGALNRKREVLRGHGIAWKNILRKFYEPEYAHLKQELGKRIDVSRSKNLKLAHTLFLERSLNFSLGILARALELAKLTGDLSRSSSRVDDSIGRWERDLDEKKRLLCDSEVEKGGTLDRKFVSLCSLLTEVKATFNKNTCMNELD